MSKIFWNALDYLHKVSFSSYFLTLIEQNPTTCKPLTGEASDVQVTEQQEIPRHLDNSASEGIFRYFALRCPKNNSRLRIEQFLLTKF